MKQMLRYSIMAILTCACCVAIVILHFRISDLAVNIAERMRYIENAPAQQQRTKQLQEQVVLAREQLQQISKVIVSQDELVDVVAHISQAASQSGVTVQIPAVANDTKSSEVLEDVRIRMSAIGSPVSLIAFLYRLEHLPYLLRIASWDLDTTYQSVLQSFAGIAPPTPNAPKAPTGSMLVVEAIISLRKQ